MRDVLTVRRIGYGGGEMQGWPARALLAGGLAASIGICLGLAGRSISAAEAESKTGEPAPAVSQEAAQEGDFDRRALERRLAELEAAVASLKAEVELLRGKGVPRT